MNDLSPDLKKVLEEYLHHLGEILKSLPQDEREEIVLEIKGHIEDKLSRSIRGGSSIDSLKNILDRLGKPEDYAYEFVTDYLLNKGIERRKISMVFKGLLRWGCNTLVGFFYSLFFFAAYLISVSFVIIGIMKPILPEKVGFFLRNGKFENFGLIMGVTNDPNVQEVLGYWLIPIALIIGILGFFVTSWLLKRVIHNRLGFWRKYQGS